MSYYRRPIRSALAFSLIYTLAARAAEADAESGSIVLDDSDGGRKFEDGGYLISTAATAARIDEVTGERRRRGGERRPSFFGEPKGTSALLGQERLRKLREAHREHGRKARRSGRARGATGRRAESEEWSKARARMPRLDRRSRYVHASERGEWEVEDWEEKGGGKGRLLRSRTEADQADQSWDVKTAPNWSRFLDSEKGQRREGTFKDDGIVGYGDGGGSGDATTSRGSSRTNRGERSLQSGGSFFADGFIVLADSPGFFRDPSPEQSNEFYCAGTGTVTDFGTLHFADGDKVILRSCLGVFDQSQIFWEYTSLLELWLFEVDHPLDQWYMTVSNYRKGRVPYIAPRHEQNPRQVWDLRPSSREAPFDDNTWRPFMFLGDQSKGDLCMSAPKVINSTQYEGAELSLKKCTNQGDQRRRQTFIYCFSGFVCNDTVVEPPEFTFEVNCDGTSERVLNCGQSDANSVSSSLAGSVRNGLWRNLGVCTDDTISGKRFDRSLAWEITDALNNQYVIVTLSSSCRTNDGNAVLRVYEQVEVNDYRCRFVGNTRCENGNKVVTAVVGPRSGSNDNFDYLAVVSGDGTDKGQRSFDINVGCSRTRPLNPTNPPLLNLNVSDALYCGARILAAVDESGNDLPSDFDDNRNRCDIEPEDLIDRSRFLGEGSLFDSKAYVVDTRNIDKEFAFESNCNTGDGSRLELETLIRIYRINDDDDNNDETYECIVSAILSCEDASRPAFRTNVSGGTRHLVVLTGAVNSEVCEDIDFDCR